MISPMGQGGWWRTLLGIVLLLALSLACNAPFRDTSPTPTQELDEDELPTEPTLERETPEKTPDFTPGSPATVPVIVGSQTATQPADSPPNTATLIIPTLAATSTATSTPTRRPLLTNTPPSGSATATASPASSGPLTFQYEITWRPHPTDPMESIARVVITAEGGGGAYRYFMGGIEVDGPVFEYTWRNCRGNPQSLTVTSANGQSVTVNYYEEPPCPTPTPTP